MRIMWLLRVSIIMAMSAIPSMTTAQIQLSPVATGLTSPVFVGHAGDGSGRLFIVEQLGILKVLQPPGAPTVFLNIQSRVLSGGSVDCSVLRSTRCTPRTAGFSSSTRRILMAPWSWLSISRLHRDRMSRERLKGESW